MFRQDFFLLSPVILVLFSLCVFLVAFFLPDAAYIEALGERSYVFLNFGSFAFLLSCVLFFVIGFLVFRCVFGGSVSLNAGEVRCVSWVWLVVPLLVCMLYCAYACYSTVKTFPFVLDVFLGDGGAVKDSPDVQDYLGLSHFVASGVMSWVLYRLNSADFIVDRKRLVYAMVATSLIIGLFASLISMARGGAIPILVSSVVSVVLPRLVVGRLSQTRVLLIGMLFGFLLLFVFSAFSFLRGAEELDKLYSDFFGYVFSSYNRFAAVWDGQLVYPYSGDGVYLSGFLSFNKTFNNLFPIAEFFGWGDYYSVWSSEFFAVSNAGLNGAMIWSSIFGYFYADFGWWSVLVFAVYGFLYAGVWGWALKGEVFGVVLYPWFLFCQFFWFGYNYLLDTKLVYLIIVACFVFLYEKAVVKHAKAT